MSDVPASAAEHLRRLQEQTHQVAREAAAFASRLESRDYTGWSRRREVRVSVGPDALVREIEFSASAPTTAPATLARAVVEAHDRALLALRDAVDEVAADAFPSAPELASLTIRGYREAVPDRVDLLDRGEGR